MLQNLNNKKKEKKKADVVAHHLKAYMVQPSQPLVLTVISHGNNVESQICTIQVNKWPCKMG